MNVWWSSLHTAHTSYEEVKHRRVVAQGWRDLGNLEFLKRLVPSHRDAFHKVIQLLGDVHYGSAVWWKKDRQLSRTPRVMWNLFSVQEGDLVVGIEGTTVKGLCQVPGSAVDTYQYQPAWEYAQTVGFPLDWHDWDTSVLGKAPTTPSKGILGIRHLSDASNAVRKAWITSGW